MLTYTLTAYILTKFHWLADINQLIEKKLHAFVYFICISVAKCFTYYLSWECWATHGAFYIMNLKQRKQASTFRLSECAAVYLEPPINTDIPFTLVIRYSVVMHSSAPWLTHIWYPFSLLVSHTDTILLCFWIEVSSYMYISLYYLLLIYISPHYIYIYFHRSMLFLYRKCHPARLYCAHSNNPTLLFVGPSHMHGWPQPLYSLRILPLSHVHKEVTCHQLLVARILSLVALLWEWHHREQGAVRIFTYSDRVQNRLLHTPRSKPRYSDIHPSFLLYQYKNNIHTHLQISHILILDQD